MTTKEGAMHIHTYGNIIGPGVRGIPKVLVLCNFNQDIDGFRQNDSQGF